MLFRSTFNSKKPIIKEIAIIIILLIKELPSNNSTTSGAKSKNIKSVKANLDLEKIKLDGDKLLGFDDQIKALKESDAYLFEIDKSVNKGLDDNGGKPRKNEGGSIDDDDLDNLTDEEYFALREKNK